MRVQFLDMDEETICILDNVESVRSAKKYKANEKEDDEYILSDYDVKFHGDKEDEVVKAVFTVRYK